MKNKISTPRAYPETFFKKMFTGGNKVYYLIIAMFVLSLAIFLFILFMSFSLEKKELEIFFNVGEIIGFDVNDTALTFGTVMPNSVSQRKIIIENDYGFDVFFKFDVEGDVEKFLVFNKIEKLKAFEKKTIEINAVAPINEPKGNYSGKMIILIKRDFW